MLKRGKAVKNDARISKAAFEKIIRSFICFFIFSSFLFNPYRSSGRNFPQTLITANGHRRSVFLHEIVLVRQQSVGLLGAREIHVCSMSLRTRIKGGSNFISAGGWPLLKARLHFSVSITGASFKGFFLQARDSNTNEWIGSWVQTPNTKIHAECSAVTHADPREKEQASFVWKAPNAAGNVYFT